MYKIGGRAHACGITFVSDIVRVRAADNGKETVKLFSARTRRVKAAFRKIPLLRIFPAFGRAFTIIFAVFIVLLLTETFVPETLYYELYIPDMVFYAILAALAAVIVISGVLLRGRIRRLLQYHGAEHMALGTYRKGKAPTAENIVRAGRASPNCGSMFVLVFLIIGVPLMFVPYSEYFLPAAFCAAFELMLLARKVKRLRWLLRFGMWAQRKIFTRQPDPEQIETARRGLTALIGIMDKQTKAL